MNKLCLKFILLISCFSSVSNANEIDDLMFKNLKEYFIGQVSLVSGVFLIKSPEKSVENSSEEEKYKDAFSSEGTGTAFLYKGYVLTNFHLCRGHKFIYVKDHLEKTFKLKVIGYNINQDVCVISPPPFAEKYTDFENFKSQKDDLIEEKNKFFEEIAKKKNIQYSAKPYLKMYSMWGEFTLTNIENDTVEDKWSSIKESKISEGFKCRGGISGSPVVSTEGFQGMGWGAENPNSEAAIKKKFKAGKNPVKYNCFFMTKNAVDKVLNSIIPPVRSSASINEKAPK